MQITKDNYINEHFLDANRTLIEVTTKEGVQAIHFNPEHPVYQDLSKVVDIETIHSNTKRYLKEQKKAFNQGIMRAAKEEELAQKVISDLSKEYFKEMYQFFVEFDEDNLEKLFNLKLYCFEQDFIKQSKDTELKKQLRLAKTPFEALSIVYKIKNSQ